MMANGKEAPWNRLLGTLPGAMLSWAAGGPLLTVVYHTVLDTPASRPSSHVDSLLRSRSKAAFAQEIDLLASRFAPVDLETVIAASQGGPKLKRPSLLVTFDDGMREVADVAMPILRARGIRPAIFVNLDFLDNRVVFWRHKAAMLADALRSLPPGDPRVAAVWSVLTERGITPKTSPGRPGGGVAETTLAVGWRERDVLDAIAGLIGFDASDFLASRPYLTHDEVRALAAEGVAIGAHGFDHPDHRQLSDEERFAEVMGSTQAVRERFGVHYSAFAFPFSDEGLPPGLFDRLFAAGIDVTFGTSWPEPSSHLRSVQRLCLEGSPRPAAVQIVRRLAVGASSRLFARPGRPDPSHDRSGRLGTRSMGEA